MSYYKGGRGSGGGYRGGSSYRGNRGGESTWRGGRGSSSFSNSSRGSRYSSYQSPAYDSRSRSSYGGSGGERYSRGAREESYHRYSQDVGYSTRDYGRVISPPEPPRKRARPDNSPSSYMAPRRSHERSFASDYSSGRSYYDKGGTSSSGGYIGEKTYTREVRERGSDFAFRKPSTYSSPRGGVGGYRGRSGRGLRSRGFRSASSFLRKRDSFAIRKRAGLSSRSEYIRRLKQLRLRRRLRAAKRQKEESDDEVDVEQEGKEDDEDEMGSVPEEEASSVEEVEEEEEIVEEEDNEEGGDQEVKEEENDEEGDVKIKEEKPEGNVEKKTDEDEPPTPKKAEPKVVKKKIVRKVKKKVAKLTAKEDIKAEEEEVENNESKEKEEKEEDSEKTPLTDFLGQPFIKLRCPHCTHGCVTFKEYSKHLETRKHQNSMQELFTKLRKTLASMRMEQRKKQRALDDDCKAKNMRLRTFFCSICKLNYRTLKSHHQASTAHRKMSEFLLPFCKVCRIWFKSAWSYESHLCELPHIKRKARLDKLSRPPSGKDDSLLADQESDMLDTSSFMILDSVGSGDDSDGEKSEDATTDKKEDENESLKDEKSDKDSIIEKKKKKKKSEIKLGAEFCKMVEVYYCDLCKLYLPRLDDRERALTIHCRSRTHLQRYVRLNNSRKDDATLRRKAVRLHKERQKQKEKEKKEKKEDGIPPKDEENNQSIEDKEEATKQSDDITTNEEVKEIAAGSPLKKNGDDEEDKMWSEVDKDLSVLLHDGDEHEPHDDDEDTKKERYDRFKQSDKPEKNSLVGEAEIKPNGSIPVCEKKKIGADSEEK